MKLETLKTQFEAFMTQTEQARRLCERDRDYKDGKQWTANEIAVLERRGQAPIVNNRILKKQNFLLGIEIRSRTDPKAFPRTPQHEEDSESITDALRYVKDNAHLDRRFSECADEYFCEGSEAVIIEVEEGTNDIKPRHIPWDRFYYDPHSREYDFGDSSYMGITVWMDRKELARRFPKKKTEIESLAETTSLESSFEDRPKWYDSTEGHKRSRVRLNEHYFLDGGVWKLVFFTGDLFLTEIEDSPYLDDMGRPMNPIEAESAYVDRENNRYGVVRGDISLQDEINHRRSKAHHMLSNVTVVMDQGAVKSASQTLNDLTSGKAAIEVTPGLRFDIDRNVELSQGQIALYQDAKNEIDDTVVQATGGDSGQSGRSKLVDRENDIDELAGLFERHKDFKNRVYRQIWCRIKQFWTEERWVRVTDDEQNIKFVGLNKPVTGREAIAQVYGIQDGQVEAFLAQEGASLMPGQLERVVRVENQVAEIDVDVILDEAPDVVTIQQEQFQVMAQLAQAYGPENVPFEEMLKLSSLRNKDEFLERTQGNPEQQQAAQQQAQQLQQQKIMMDMQKSQSETAVNVANARKANVLADQAQVETQLALFGEEKIG